MTATVFQQDCALGALTLEPLDLERHLVLLHGWVTDPQAVYWQLQGASVQDVRDTYLEIARSGHQHVWLGRLDGEPLFLAETYDPARSELATHYEVRAGDVGMHLLVSAPTGAARPGLTSAVMRAVMSFVLADPATHRVVVEPDERNDRIAAKNVEAGFAELARVRLSDKVARLSLATRQQFDASPLGGRGSTSHRDRPGRKDPMTSTAALDLALSAAMPEHLDHLAPGPMASAHRMLVRKAVAELAHERLVQPEPDPGAGPDAWTLRAGTSMYRFRARVLALEHWLVDPASIEREADGAPAELDAQQLVVELRERLAIPDELLGTYLEEIAATLAGSAWKHQHQRHSADDLVGADFQTIEAAMAEGHPGFIANNGRIGYSLDDHERYAPEAGRPVHLVWLAALRSESALSCGEGVDETSLYAEQLGDLVPLFERRLRELGLDPADYRYLPVHPWQWQNKLAVTFAPDVARRALVPVGTSADAYQAQQSIRTFFDLDRPERHYVKTALAIQNMGFQRGLSPRYMEATPAINDWVADVVRGDEVLRRNGFDVLREVAAVGWTGCTYHRAAALTSSTRTSAYQKMVAALWRESPLARIGPGERLATMASLLHRDREGRHLVTAMVAASGVPARRWVSSYLAAYLRPVVHCLLAHDLAFMPHGENVILVLEGHVPTRSLMKDLGEEVAVLNADPLPEAIRRVQGTVSPETAVLAVFTDVFDGFLRFLAGILDDDGVLPADEFWELAGTCVADHARELPHLHTGLDLFASEFAHSCLNRLQLRNTLQMVDLTDHASSMLYAGTMPNPIARWRPGGE